MTTNAISVMAAKSFDLSGAWDTFWSAITAGTGIGPILNVMAVVGVAIVVVALIKWAWERRRGGGGGGFGQQSSAVWGALLVGCLLSAPQIIIPILLTVLDLVANAGLSVWNKTAK